MKKLVGVMVAIVATFLWFAPFVTNQMAGMEIVRSGADLGKMSYLLLAAAWAGAIFGYIGKADLIVVSATVGFAVSGLYVAATTVNEGTTAEWGVFGECMAFAMLLVIGLVQWWTTRNRPYPVRPKSVK